MTNSKDILKGRTYEEMETLAIEMGQRAFQGRQAFKWINQKKVKSFDEMTDLSKAFRQKLDERFDLPQLSIKTSQHSDDGTVKYLVELTDNETVEAVFIPTKGRNTLCVSTQVGCKMACRFCATGYQKFTRDLKAWEIVEQYLSLPFPAPVTNIVFMGMGEPFDNYDEVIKALKIFQHPNGPKIGKRHITVSTVGLSPKIEAFVQANLGKLAISLHGTTDEQRGKIMPINRKYPIENLMETCKKLALKRSTRITWEYILIKDINDSPQDAHRLAALLKDIPSKINLLAYNENPFVNFKRPEESRVIRFQEILMAKGYVATYRKSRGRDIAGACGQLRSGLIPKTETPLAFNA